MGPEQPKALEEAIEALPRGTYLSAADLHSICPDPLRCEQVLAEHARTQDLRQVVPGLYYKGTRTRFGVTAPDVLSAAIATARHAGIASGVGPAQWSASNLLRLSTQIPRRVHVAIPSAVPQAPVFVQYHLRPGTSRAGLSVLEVALIEILRDDLRYVESSFEDLIERVRHLHGEDLIAIESLRRAAEHEPDIVGQHLDDLRGRLDVPTG